MAKEDQPGKDFIRLLSHQLRAPIDAIESLLNAIVDCCGGDADDILNAYGFRIPQGALAVTAEEAVEIADRIGYPVAMKIASPNIIHKSVIGGVQLNLFDADSVEDGFELMMMKTSGELSEI